MADEENLLVPDAQVLADIFPNLPGTDDVYKYVTLYSSTYEVCTFRAQLPVPNPNLLPQILLNLGAAVGVHVGSIVTGGDRSNETSYRPEFPVLHPLESDETLFTDLVVRLETTFGSTLYSRLCRSARVRMSAARFSNSLSCLTQRAPSTLEPIWRSIDKENQQALMASIVEAMGKLQALPFEGHDVQAFLAQYGASMTPDGLAKTTMWHPSLGACAGFKELLKRHIECFGLNEGQNKHLREYSQIMDRGDGIVLRTEWPNALMHREEVHFSKADLDALSSSVVFCHQDLEPRNIMVKKNPDGSGSWVLSAIIDWECAGFVPFAFEFGQKDVILGHQNLLFYWYRWFKDQSVALLPPGCCHHKLIHALRLIGQLYDDGMKFERRAKFDCPPHKKWMEREWLDYKAPMVGYVRGTILTIRKLSLKLDGENCGRCGLNYRKECECYNYDKQGPTTNWSPTRGLLT